MLRGIPACLSPELVSAMMRMGHGDELILADVDFPADTYGQNILRADGVPMETMLQAVLALMPLDGFVEDPAVMMDAVDAPQPPEWKAYEVMVGAQCRDVENLKYIDRFAFYERAKKSFVVVVTGEADGNILLRKGVVGAPLNA